MHPLLALIDTFSPDNYARGVQFEKLSKWILETHPLYKSKFKKVWHFLDWPECWGRDKGIDLVAEDFDGNTWAIQAKCYDPQYYVTKTDLDKFLSESTNTKIHHRLLIATTDCLIELSRVKILLSSLFVPHNCVLIVLRNTLAIVIPKS